MIDVPEQPALDSADNIFADALEIPESGRPSYVRARCGGNTELSQLVFELLSSHKQLGGFMEPADCRRDPLLGYCAIGDLLLDRFEITAILGAGGMGEVYSAIDREAAGNVALKFIQEKWTSNPVMRVRLRRELRTRSVAHPNICPIFELYSGMHRSREVVFFSMAFLNGESLEEVLAKRKCLPLAETHSIIAGVANGLSAAHQAGVIHRDLKPSNIILVPDKSGSLRPVILDFGISQAADLSSVSDSATQPDAILGSPRYMAPEQFLNSNVTPAADIFALAVIAFEMLSGTRPYPDGSIVQNAISRLQSPVRPLADLLPGIPASWTRAIERALRPDPLQRPQTAADFMNALSGSLARPYARMLPRRPSRRAIVVAATGAAAGLTFPFVPGLRGIWQPRIPISPLVMMSEFSFDGQRGNQQAASAISFLIARQLQQSAHLAVVDRGEMERHKAVMSASRKTPLNPSEPEIARELALRSGANVILFGAVATAGELRTVNLSLEILSNATSHSLKSLTHSFAIDEGAVMAEASRVAAAASTWIRTSLLESGQLIRATARSSQDLTTSSWEALSEYTLAVSLGGRSQYDEAISHLKNALQIDPGFALAAARIGDYSLTLDRQDDAFKYWILSNDLLTQRNLTDRESLSARGNFALDTAQPDLAEQILKRYTSTFPADSRGYFELATAEQRLGNDQAAAVSFRRAIELRPAWPSPRYKLCEHLLYMAKPKECEAQWQVARNVDKAKDDWGLQIGVASAFGLLDKTKFDERLAELERSAPEARCRALQMRACAAAEKGDSNRALYFANAALNLAKEELASFVASANSLLLLAELTLASSPAQCAAHCHAVLEMNTDFVRRTKAVCILARLGRRSVAQAAQIQKDNEKRIRLLSPSLLALPSYAFWQAQALAEIAFANGLAKKAFDIFSNAPGMPNTRSWNAVLYRFANHAGEKQTAKQLLDVLLRTPARFWIDPSLTAPGYLSLACSDAIAVDWQNHDWPERAKAIITFWRS